MGHWEQTGAKNRERPKPSLKARFIIGITVAVCAAALWWLVLRSLIHTANLGF